MKRVDLNRNQSEIRRNVSIGLHNFKPTRTENSPIHYLIICRCEAYIESVELLACLAEVDDGIAIC
jgi:hypothetical protein